MKYEEIVEKSSEVRCVEEARNASSLRNKGSSNFSTHHLWLFFHFPQFFLQTLISKLEKQNAYVLVDLSRNDPKILQLNQRAEDLGIYRGMSLSLVSEIDGVKFLERNSSIEREVINQLLTWANRFTPMVVNKLPDGILMEIKGSLALFGGVDRFLKRASRSLSALGYQFNYSISLIPSAAEFVAKAGLKNNILHKKCLNESLSQVSINTLDLSLNTLKILHQMGVKTLGDCRRLPRKGLIDRFGVGFIKQFDTLYGNIQDPQTAFKFPEKFSVVEELSHAVGSWIELKAYIVKILGKMRKYLVSRVAKTNQLNWTFYGETFKKEVVIRLSDPSIETSMMLRILEEKMKHENFQGYITSLRLAVNEVKNGQQDNLNILEEQKKPTGEFYNEFISRIRLRYGEKSLYNLIGKAAHIPEDSFVHLYSVDKKTTEKPLLNKIVTSKKRPVWLINPPQKLAVVKNKLFYDGRLSLVSERERIVNGWWKGKEIARDYFMAESDSKMLLWIYKDLSNEENWYLQGIFE